MRRTRVDQRGSQKNRAGGAERELGPRMVGSPNEHVRPATGLYDEAISRARATAGRSGSTFAARSLSSSSGSTHGRCRSDTQRALGSSVMSCAARCAERRRVPPGTVVRPSSRTPEAGEAGGRGVAARCSQADRRRTHASAGVACYPRVRCDRARAQARRALDWHVRGATRRARPNRRTSAKARGPL